MSEYGNRNTFWSIGSTRPQTAAAAAPARRGLQPGAHIRSPKLAQPCDGDVELCRRRRVARSSRAIRGRDCGSAEHECERRSAASCGEASADRSSSTDSARAALMQSIVAPIRPRRTRSRVSTGVSAPRNSTRQPSARSITASISSPMSCCSPGRAREHGDPVRASAPVGEQLAEVRAHLRRDRMLLRDRQLAAVPRVAGPAQGGCDDVGQRLLRGTARRTSDRASRASALRLAAADRRRSARPGAPRGRRVPREPASSSTRAASPIRQPSRIRSRSHSTRWTSVSV